MKKLIYILIFACCFLVGCPKNNSKSEGEQNQEGKYIYATVVKKAGTVVALQKAIDSNQPIMILNENFRRNLLLKLKTDDGKIYYFDVDLWGSPSLEIFNFALDEGTRVKIEKDDFYCQLKGRIGAIRTSEIEILENSYK